MSTYPASVRRIRGDACDLSDGDVFCTSRSLDGRSERTRSAQLLAQVINCRVYRHQLFARSFSVVDRSVVRTKDVEP